LSAVNGCRVQLNPHLFRRRFDKISTALIERFQEAKNIAGNAVWVIFDAKFSGESESEVRILKKCVISRRIEHFYLDQA
jgi:predicted RNA-binding protein with PIN domain